MTPSGWKDRAKKLLLDRGAASTDHPGGTLFEHVCRVSDLLAAWGAREELQAAGLCHACYGTDGFAVALLGLGERSLLVESIGAEAEAIVYSYDACDRSAVYPRLGSAEQLFMTDRFTQESSALGERSARDFLELTAANELDLVLVTPEAPPSWSGDFYRLLLRSRKWLSPQAINAWKTSLTEQS